MIEKRGVSVYTLVFYGVKDAVQILLLIYIFLPEGSSAMS